MPVIVSGSAQIGQGPLGAFVRYSYDPSPKLLVYIRILYLNNECIPFHSWEGKIEQAVVDDLSIPKTDRLAIIRVRKGQRLQPPREAQLQAT